MKKFSFSDRTKNVARISTGTFLGQLVQAVSLPFVMRIYGSSRIGIATFLLALTAIITALSDLGCSNAIMLEDDEEKIHRTYRVISSCSFVICAFTALIITLYDRIFSLNLEGIHPLFLFFFLFIDFFISQQINTCYTWLVKKKRYDILMRNPLLRYTSFSVIAILLGLLHFTIYGYFIAHLISLFFSYINMRRLLPKHSFLFSKEAFLELVRKYNRFIRYEMPANLFAYLRSQLPMILIKGLFGNVIAGYYSACTKILNIPMTFLANSMGKVFFQVASELRNNCRQAGEFALRNIKKAMKYGFLPNLIFLSLGDVVIHLLYGHEYDMSGEFMQIIPYVTFITFISITVQGIATILNRQKHLMVSLIIQSILCTFSFLIGTYLFESIFISLILYTISTVLTYLVYFCCLFASVHIPWKKFFLEMILYYSLMFVSSLALRYLLNYTTIYSLYL